MSFAMDALQSRLRREANNNNKLQSRVRDRQSKRANEPIVATMGAVAKDLADIVSNVINKIWPNNETPPRPNPILRDVTIDVDDMIVYDEPTEDGFVEVALASRVQTPARDRRQSKDTFTKPSASSPITIPKRSMPIHRRERKEIHHI